MPGLGKLMSAAKNPNLYDGKVGFNLCLNTALGLGPWALIRKCFLLTFYHTVTCVIIKTWRYLLKSSITSIFKLAH